MSDTRIPSDDDLGRPSTRDTVARVRAAAGPLAARATSAAGPLAAKAGQTAGSVLHGITSKVRRPRKG